MQDLDIFHRLKKKKTLTSPQRGNATAVTSAADERRERWRRANVQSRMTPSLCITPSDCIWGWFTQKTWAYCGGQMSDTVRSKPEPTQTDSIQYTHTHTHTEGCTLAYVGFFFMGHYISLDPVTHRWSPFCHFELYLAWVAWKRTLTSGREGGRREREADGPLEGGEWQKISAEANEDEQEKVKRDQWRGKRWQELRDKGREESSRSLCPFVSATTRKCIVMLRFSCHRSSSRGGWYLWFSFFFSTYPSITRRRSSRNYSLLPPSRLSQGCNYKPPEQKHFKSISFPSS